MVNLTYFQHLTLSFTSCTKNPRIGVISYFNYFKNGINWVSCHGINSSDEATKSNSKKIFYENEEISEGYNIRGNSQSVGATPSMSRNSNLLCDKIHNTKILDVQVELILDTYHGEGDPMAQIKSFEMKLKLKFGVNDNLMSKYFPIIFKGDALN